MKKDLKEELSKFGVTDEKIFAKLERRGRIKDIISEENLMIICYEKGKYPLVHVEKITCSRLNPKDKSVIELISEFKINFNPDRNYVNFTGGRRKNSEQYDEYGGMWG